MNKHVLALKAFWLRRNRSSSSLTSIFCGNPFFRTYRLLERARAPKDFPFYFISELNQFHLGAPFNAIVVCKVNANEIRYTPCPYIAKHDFEGKTPTFERARKLVDGFSCYNYLAAPSFTPLSVLVLNEEDYQSDEFYKVCRSAVPKLQEFSGLCGIPVYGGYSL